MKRTLGWGGVSLVLLLACGGDPEPVPDRETPDSTAGSETVETEPVEQQHIEEAAPSGPGSLRVVNRVDGEDTEGTVQVLDDSGEVVAEGTSGQTFQVPAGRYRVVGTISDATVLIDTPTKESEDSVTVEPGGEATASIDHARARVRIRVLRNNRPVGRWRLEMQRRGSEETIEITPTDDYIPLTAGRYSGTVHVGTLQVEVTDVVLSGGAQRDLPIRIQ